MWREFWPDPRDWDREEVVGGRSTLQRWVDFVGQRQFKTGLFREIMDRYAADHSRAPSLNQVRQLYHERAGKGPGVAHGPKCDKCSGSGFVYCVVRTGGAPAVLVLDYKDRPVVCHLTVVPCRCDLGRRRGDCPEAYWRNAGRHDEALAMQDWASRCTRLAQDEAKAGKGRPPAIEWVDGHPQAVLGRHMVDPAAAAWAEQDREEERF